MKEEEQASITAKPWAYWWWMGNSVTKEGITTNLTLMLEAGFGGVHIVPIYGEKGDEANFISYLSPEWMDMLVHTANETKRLGMGVDITTGTGWPFGGPQVDSIHAAKRMNIKRVELTNQVDLHQIIHKGVKGYSFYDHQGICILSGTPDRLPQWNDIEKANYVLLLEERLTRQKVKRAAPGGEGLVVDYYSKESISEYMDRFEKAFRNTSFPDGKVRAFYNDSYEVYGANFTNDFLTQFQSKRGYDLLPYLNVLNDTADCEIKRRIVSDYCETMSDLLLEEFTCNWVEKSQQLGFVTRNQAHGSPGNLLDLYEVADIPETESFGSSGFPIPGLSHDRDYSEERFGRPNPLTMKFASSAAHTNGKQLVSSETATWLADHFKVTLAQVKPQVDELFVAGINHVFYHGVTYTPPEKEFPGRLFYASTNFGPHSHFWNELPLLNRYIADCQTILQDSKPDNDILLYFAIHDVWDGLKEKTIIRLLDVHKSDGWLKSKATGKLAGKLWSSGFAFDFISDRSILNSISASQNLLNISELKYKALMVPSVGLMPVETLRQLHSLAKQGAVIYFENDIPEDVPGLRDVEGRRDEMKRIKSELLSLPNVKIFKDVNEIAVNRESMTDLGLEYIRKKYHDETMYFITNLSDRFSEEWVELSKSKRHIVLYDPQNMKRGNALTKDGKIFLQLPPGTSCFVFCSDRKSTQQYYPYYNVSGKPVDISYDWNLVPLKGNPVLPTKVQVDNLTSWTGLNNDFIHFSGTVSYQKEFELSDDILKSDAIMLEIETLKETATVTINGKNAGTMWSIPNRLYIPSSYFEKHNIIEIDVTNTSFNRIIDLERRNTNWKNFHEINFVNILYEPYDASDKEPVESGIIGSVTLTPNTYK